MKLTADIEFRFMSINFETEATSIEDFIANVKKIKEGLAESGEKDPRSVEED